MENPRRALGTNGATASEPKTASARVPQSSRSRQSCDERYPVRASNRLPMERIESYGHLQQLIGASTIHGVDRSRSLPGLLGMRSTCLRRGGGNRLVLALDGWSNDQGTARWGKKLAPTLRTGRRGERSGVCSQRPRASLSASWSMAPIETTSSCLSRRSRAFQFAVRNRRELNLKGCVWTKDTTTPKSENSPLSSGSLLTSVPGEKKRKRSSLKPDFVLDVGSWKGRIVG